MRKSILIFFTLVFCFLSYQVFTNAGGPTTGVAGDPPLNETCAESGCHVGSALNSGSGTSSIICKDSLNAVVTSYIPNHTYTITLSITEGNKTRYGFEAIVLKGTGITANAIGTIVLTDAVRTQLFGATKKYVMHKLAGIDFTGITGSWSFNWKAPANNNGTATVYAAFNASNKSNSDAGDKIYTKTLDLTGTGPFVGINALCIKHSNRIFPNPAVAEVNFDVPAPSMIRIYNLSGEVVRILNAVDRTIKTDLSALPQGIYIAEVINANGSSRFKFIKQ